MAYSNFKPSIWSRSLNLALTKALVAKALVNNNFQGEVTQGSVVKITRPSGITIHDYSGGDITPEEGSSSQLEFSIDKAKAFNFLVDDLDAIQANQDLVKVYIEEASKAMQLQVDADILNYLKDNADEDNMLGLGTTLTKSNILESITSAMEAMNKANVPLQGRILIISPAEHKLLIDAKGLSPATVGNDAIVASGVIGQVAGFNVLLSTNLYEELASDIDTGDPVSRYLLFGHPMSTTFASQVNKVEAYRTQNSFKDGVKGLMTYGMKTIEPKALGVILNKIGVGTA